MDIKEPLLRMIVVVEVYKAMVAKIEMCEESDKRFERLYSSTDNDGCNDARYHSWSGPRYVIANGSNHNARKSLMSPAEQAPHLNRNIASSLTLFSCDQVLDMKHVQQLLGLLKAVQTNQTPPTAGEAKQPASTRNKSTHERQVAAGARKLKFKTVNEM